MDVDRLERAIALEELIRRSPSETDRLASDLLRDGDPRIRIMAVEGVAKLALASRLSDIQRLLRTEREPAVIAAMIDATVTLSQGDGRDVASPELERVLLAAAEHSDPTVRCAAVQAVGSLRVASGIPSLLSCLSDRRVAVRLSAADALGELGSETEIEALDRARRKAFFPVSRRIYKAAVHRIQARCAGREVSHPGFGGDH